MKVVRARHLAAGNVLSASPVMVLVLDDASSPEDLAAVGRAIAAAIDLNVRRGACSERAIDFPAWPRLERGAADSVASMVEALALLAQRCVGWPVSFSGIDPDDDVEPPGAAVVYEARRPDVGRKAGEVALEMVRAALAGSADLATMFRQQLDVFRRSTQGFTPAVDTMEIALTAERRGIPWATVPAANWLRLGFGRPAHLLHCAEATSTSQMGKWIAGDKAICTPILAAVGLPVPRHGNAFSEGEAVRVARRVGFPVVVKPATSHLGLGVTIGVASEPELTGAFLRAQAETKCVVIESVLEGDEYRLLVIGGVFFAAARRMPAHIIGDGSKTIRQLVDDENARPARHRPPLVPLKLDDDARACLRQQDLTEDARPTAGRIVALRLVSNVSQGGTSVDVTDEVHPSIRDMAVRAAEATHVDICGIDFITTDIGKPYWETGGGICEINARPMLGIHTGVVEGKRRDPAEAIVSHLFPGTSRGRTPCVLILDREHEGRTRALLEAIAGAASAKGLRVQAARNASSQTFAPRLDAALWDRTLDAILLALEPEEVLERGVGIDRIDLAILPTTSDDPMVAQASAVLARMATRVVDCEDGSARQAALAVLSGTGSSSNGTTSNSRPR